MIYSCIVDDLFLLGEEALDERMQRYNKRAEDVDVAVEFMEQIKFWINILKGCLFCGNLL